MKLYLDDIRNPEQTYPYATDWLVVRNYNEFILVLEKHFSDLEIISFDHDIDSYDEKGNELTYKDYYGNYQIKGKKVTKEEFEEILRMSKEA